MKWLPLLLIFPALGACDRLPRDQDGTLERISQTGEVRVGLIAPIAQSPHSRRLVALVERSAAVAGAAPVVTTGASEPLLLRLEAGELDLVVGEFDSTSPWYHRVHLLLPIAQRSEGGSRLEATAAARNGENGWIMLLEREARALAVQS